MTPKKQDALIGRRVRISDLALTPELQAHPWQGRVAEVLTKNKGNSYQLAIGDELKVLSMDQFTVILDDSLANQQGPSRLIEASPWLVAFSLTNPRKHKGLDIDSLNGLAASIKAQGLAQAVLARPLPGARAADTFQDREEGQPLPEYELVCGERRVRASRIAGMDTIPMLVREMSDDVALELQLVENIDREDLDPMEEAEGFEALRVRLGYTVEQIAERIAQGKGTSYVYKTLKLCELAPAAREAMHEGPNGEKPVLGRSTGLLVARYRPEQQLDVVAFIKSMAQDGEPAPYRTVAPAVFKRFNLALGEAVFDIYSVDLVVGVGSCAMCPKRTANQREIFEDANTAPDSCTDPDCFAAKREAHIGKVKDQAAKDGFKVIDGDEARAAVMSPHSRYLMGYSRLSDTAYTEKGADDTERTVTFEDALRAMGKKAPKPRILINPHTGEAEKVITTELANKLTPDPDEAPRGRRTAPVVDDRPAEQIALDNRDVERAVLMRIFDAIRTGNRTVVEMRIVAKALWALAENSEALLAKTEAYLGWTDELEDQDGDVVLRIVGEKLDAMQAEQLAQVMAMAAIEVTLNMFHTTGAQHVAIAEFYGIDILAVQAKVAEDLERQSADAERVQDEAEYA